MKITARPNLTAFQALALEINRRDAAAASKLAKASTLPRPKSGPRVAR